MATPVVSKSTVLLVDDEQKLLDSVSLHLRRDYQLLTATSGATALELLAAHPDTAVIVSDMRMPVMDGAKFLAKARAVAPDATRILLTGQTDMSAAISAVNEGRIFRFLTKPCPPPELQIIVKAAAAQHRLQTAEKILLEQTLQGSIRALVDVLALVNPQLFGRAMRVKHLVGDLAARLDMPDRWQVEMAAMLSQVPYVTLPADTVEKLNHGKDLLASEQQMVARLPVVIEQLLGQVPRLEVVRAMMINAYQPFHSHDYQQAQPGAKHAARGGQMIAVAVNYDLLIAGGMPMSDALGMLRSQSERFDPVLVRILAEQVEDAAERLHSVEISIHGLLPGMTLASDMRTTDGVLLMARGFEITATFIERIRNFPPGALADTVMVTAVAAES
jgi:response regulator RpfG family c-di-GMP phosphodiesterase